MAMTGFGLNDNFLTNLSAISGSDHLVEMFKKNDLFYAQSTPGLWIEVEYNSQLVIHEILVQIGHDEYEGTSDEEDIEMIEKAMGDQYNYFLDILRDEYEEDYH